MTTKRTCRIVSGDVRDLSGGSDAAYDLIDKTGGPADVGQAVGEFLAATDLYGGTYEQPTILRSGRAIVVDLRIQIIPADRWIPETWADQRWFLADDGSLLLYFADTREYTDGEITREEHSDRGAPEGMTGRLLTASDRGTFEGRCWRIIRRLSGSDAATPPEGTYGNKTIHDVISEIDPDLIPLFAHPDGDVTWLHEWLADSHVGRQISEYLGNVEAITQLTLDQDTSGIWRTAANQCLTWAFG